MTTEIFFIREKNTNNYLNINNIPIVYTDEIFAGNFIKKLNKLANIKYELVTSKTT